MSILLANSFVKASGSDKRCIDRLGQRLLMKSDLGADLEMEAFSQVISPANIERSRFKFDLPSSSVAAPKLKSIPTPAPAIISSYTRNSICLYKDNRKYTPALNSFPEQDISSPVSVPEISPVSTQEVDLTVDFSKLSHDERMKFLFAAFDEDLMNAK